MDSNNRNNSLDDVLMTFTQDQGLLTESERNISEYDIQCITDSAWSFDDVPFLEMEDVDRMEKLRNNYVEKPKEDLWKSDKSFHVMHRRSEPSSEDGRPPRRQCTLRRSTNEDRTPPALHYTYQDEIALGMDQMRVTQEDIPENDEDDEEEDDEEDSSESSSSASSSSSEYQPGPSSPRGSTSKTKEPSLVGRRLRKKQKMQMTQKELNERRMEANRKNSKNYNKNKKIREQSLTDEYARKKEMIQTMNDCNSAADVKILECFSCMREYMRISECEMYISENAYRARKDEVDKYSEDQRRTDRELRKLYENLCKRKRSYDIASKDIKTKKSKTNTYGSRKSRALHSMNIAKFEYKVHNLDFEVIKQNEWTRLMEMVKQELEKVFIWGRVPEDDYKRMTPNTIRQIDHLIGFLSLPL